MCVGGAPKAPAAPPALPEAPQTPAAAPTDDADKRRRRAAAGETGAGTILTGSRGIQDGATGAAKTLLGT